MLNRRKFVKWSSFITVSAASTTLLAGCGGDDDNGNTSPGAGTSSDNSGNTSPGAGTSSGMMATGFSHGVASGDPRADSIVLWTRADGGDGVSPLALEVQVATDQAFTTLVVDARISALPEWDYTVRHKVTGLKSGAIYYYRFLSGSSTSTVGRTWTAPAAGTPLSELKLIFVSCQDWLANHWGAYADMMDEDVDFIVHLGDYIYEVPSQDPGVEVEARHTAITLPSGSSYANTVDDYRTLYGTYRSDARIQAVHANWPFISIWDDHEFSDDAWQDRSTYDADNPEQLARRRNANQVWYEWTPADVSFTPDETASFEDIQIYRSFSFGDLATLVMTDERLYRADHVIPETATGSRIGSRYLVPLDAFDSAEAQKMSAAGGALTPVSMLGDTQRAWWQQQMAGAATTWKLWGNEVSLLRMQVDGLKAVAQLMTQSLVQTFASYGVDLTSYASALTEALETDLTAAHDAGQTSSSFTAVSGLLTQVGAEAYATTVVASLNTALSQYADFLRTFLLDADQWDGYNAERKALMGFLQSSGIQNVVALTGDIHAFFAGPVMDDYDAVSPQPVMVDLVTAGISSSSLFTFYREFLSASSTYSALSGLVYDSAGTNRLNATLSAYNPWLRYLSTDAQGYALVTITPSALTCQFKQVAKLDGSTTAPSPAVTGLTTLVVNAGTADVTVQG